MGYIELEGVLYTNGEYEQLLQLTRRHRYAEAKPIMRQVLQAQKRRTTGIGQRRHHNKK